MFGAICKIWQSSFLAKLSKNVPIWGPGRPANLLNYRSLALGMLAAIVTSDFRV